MFKSSGAGLFGLVLTTVIIGLATGLLEVTSIGEELLGNAANTVYSCIDRIRTHLFSG